MGATGAGATAGEIRVSADFGEMEGDCSQPAAVSNTESSHVCAESPAHVNLVSRRESPWIPVPARRRTGLRQRHRDRPIG